MLHTEGKFYFRVEGRECHLLYSKHKENIDFFSTFVPEELRGRGLATHLISHGLAWARDNNLSVIPTCSAVLRYIRKYPDSVT